MVSYQRPLSWVITAFKPIETTWNFQETQQERGPGQGTAVGSRGLGHTALDLAVHSILEGLGRTRNPNTFHDPQQQASYTSGIPLGTSVPKKPLYLSSKPWALSMNP